MVAIISISVLRLPPLSFAVALRRHSFRSITFISAASRRHQNPSQKQNVSRKFQQQQTNKSLLRARESVKHLSSSSLAPVLSPEDKPQLSQNQAIGLVAASQANFMRVIVQYSPLAHNSGTRNQNFKQGEDFFSPGEAKGGGEGGIEDLSSTGEARGRDFSSRGKEAKGGEGGIGTKKFEDFSSLGGAKGGGEGGGIGTRNFECGEDFLSLGEAKLGGEGGIGVELLCVVRAVLKKIKRRVLVGDRVLVGSIDWIDRRGMIENVFQRRTEVGDPPVANVDHLVVLFSMDQPKPEPFSLTRFLVEAESTGIPFSVALNKSELASEETLVMWKSRLRSWGYDPIFCSVESKDGINTLQFNLREQTSVIVGPSGVGKSSLINVLRSNKRVLASSEDENWFDPILGSNCFGEQRVGEVSTRSGRGKHTTRHVSLLPLSSGGYLADTPGFNQPSLMKVTKQSLAQYFPEIRKMLKENERAKCSFNNCLHIGEPGCIVAGDWERYAYYLQLLDEIKIREEFQLRTIGTKREGDVRYKMGDMGVKQAEPRLETKKHRRPSRKKVKQSILNELENELEEFDDDEDVLEATREEDQ